MNKTFRYEYVTLIGVHDGDTLTADVDQGLHGWQRDEVFRLYGIQAPELSKPGGAEAREYLIGLLKDATIELQTFKNKRTNLDKKEKYGRWLAVAWATKPGKSALNVNLAMVDSGHAIRFMENQ
jgi:endonuclease YncB( thermonuclease family)